jgi:Cdc6-like AAA superfamily ATPase
LLEGENRLLWIYGIPGAGKTVMASFIIEEIAAFCAEKQLNEQYGQTYYYCDFRRNQDETCHFLIWIISQLCRQKEAMPEQLQILVERGTAIAYDDLIVVLEAIVQKFSSVYVIIDGLDESKNRDNLLMLIQKLASSARLSKMRIIAASREEEDIKRALTCLGSSISMSNSFVDEDIAQFIEVWLKHDQKMLAWPEDLRREVKQKLTNGARGM